MKAYLPVTENGSPEWEKASALKQKEREWALRDPVLCEAFRNKHGHTPEDHTLDEFQEAHDVPLG
jgi:hypothetical protein